MDELEQLYGLFNDNELTGGATIDDFRNADDTQKKQLFDLLKSNKIDGGIDYDTFNSAWGEKKNKISDSTSQNQELDSVQEMGDGSSDIPKDNNATFSYANRLEEIKNDKNIKPITTKPSKKEDGYASEQYRALSKGSSRLGRDLAAVPEFIYDIFSIPQNYIGEKLGIEFLKTDSEAFKETVGVDNVIKDYYNEQINKISEQQQEFDRAYSGDITDNIKQGNYVNAFRMIGNSITESLPASLSIAISGGTASAPQILAGTTAVFGAGSNEDYKEENPEMNTSERAVKSLGKGFAEGVFSLVGESRIGAAAKDLLKKEGEKEGGKILKAQLIDIYTEALKKYPIPSAMLGEGIEEAATQITQNAIDDKPLMEGVSDSFLVGMGSGGVFGTALEGIKRVSKNKITPEDIKNIESIKEKDNSVKAELEQQVLDGDLNRKQAKDIFDNWEEIKSSLQAVPEDFTPEQKAKAVEIINEKKKLESEIEGKEPALVESKKAKIEELNNQLKEISNAKTEETTIETQEQEVVDSTPKTETLETSFAEQLGETEDIGDIVQGATKTKVGDSDIVLKENGDTIKLESISTPTDKRGLGSAKKALNKLTTLADAQGKTIELNVVPLDETTNPEKLVQLYESLGFTKEENFDIDGGKMTRIPNVPPQGDVRHLSTFLSKEVSQYPNKDISEYEDKFENKKVFELAKKAGVKVVLITDEIRKNPLLDVEGGKYVGDGLILINPKYIDKDYHGTKTIQHEASHAYTAAVLISRDLNSLTKEEKQFRSGIEEIFNSKKTFLNKEYGFRNTSEFVAEFLSNEKFRNKVKGEDLSFFDKVKKFIAEFINKQTGLKIEDVISNFENYLLPNETTQKSNTKSNANVRPIVEPSIEQGQVNDVQATVEPRASEAETQISDLDYAKQEIEKGVTLWDGNPYSPRVDLGISRADVKKGEADILRGKPNSVPAQRLIQAIKEAKDKGGYDFMQGSGANISKTFVPLTQELVDNTQLTEEENNVLNTERDELSNEYDTWFNALDEQSQNEILDDYENTNERGEIGEDAEIRESQENVVDKKTAEPRQEVKKPFKKKKGKKSLLNRLIEGDNPKLITETLETLGKEYDVRNQEEVDRFANAFIDKVGIGEALSSARNKTIQNTDVRFVVYAEALERLKNEIDTANLEDRDALIEQFKELTNDFDMQARDAGQGIAILNYIYNKNQNLKYSLERQIAEYKANDINGEIPADILKKFKELDAKLKSLEKQTKEAEERAKKAEEELAIKNTKEDIKRQKSTKAKQEKAYKILANKVRTAKIHKPGIFSSATPATLVWDGAVEVVAKTIEGGGLVADAVQKGLEYIKSTDWYKNLSKKDQQEAETTFKESIENTSKPEVVESADGSLKIQNSLLRYYVEQGYEDVNEIAELIQKDIEDIYPDVDIREIRDAITGYGKQMNPSKDEINARISKLKEYGRLLSAYEDVTKGKMPLKSGLMRRKPEQEARELRRKINRLAKELELEAIDPEVQWANAIDKIKSNLKNQIEDLDKQIAKGEKRKIERTNIKLDSEAESLQKIRDEKRKFLDELVGKPELTDEQKISRAESLLEKAISKIEKEIENYDIEIKEKATPVQSSKINNLKAEYSALKDIKNEMREQAGINEKKRLETTKKRIKNQIEEYRKRLRDKDFSKREAKVIQPDSELETIRAEREAVFEEYEKERHRQELQNRTERQKWIDAALEGTALGRAIKSSLDLGLIGIQLRHFTYREILNNPVGFGKKLMRMFGSIGSQTKTDRYRKQLLAHPLHSLANKLDIGLTNPDLRDEVREEASAGSLLSFAWNMPMMIAENLGAKKFTQEKRKSIGDTFIDGFKKKSNEILGTELEITEKQKFSRREQWQNLNLFKDIERGLSSYGNQMRFEEFLRGVHRLKAEGKDEINHKEDYEALASYIRTFSGRAKPAGFQMNQKALNLFFFSFKNAASIFQQLNPAYYIYLQTHTSDNKHGGVRFKPTVANQMAMTSMLRTNAANMTTLAFIMAGYAAIKDEDDEEMTLETDPRSSDFGKIRLGSFRYDPWGGYMPLIVLYARLFTEEVKKQDGEIYVMGENRSGIKNRLDATLRFVFNKEAPITAMAHKYIESTPSINKETGETFRKTPFGGDLYEDEAFSMMPIFMSSVKEAAKNDYDNVKWFLTAYSLLGLGNTQDYGSPKEKSDKKEKTIEERIDARLKSLDKKIKKATSN